MPTHIVIVVEYEHRENVLCATFATSLEEAENIANDWKDGYHFANIVPCDYSMRNE